jgi:hypothetical protein
MAPYPLGMEVRVERYICSASCHRPILQATTSELQNFAERAYPGKRDSALFRKIRARSRSQTYLHAETECRRTSSVTMSAPPTQEIARAPEVPPHNEWLTSSGHEHMCGSLCIYCCICQIDTIYMPKDCASCWGCTGKTQCLCEVSEEACCVLPGHPHYGALRVKDLHMIDLLGEDQEPLMICCSKKAVLTKPKWITGETPFLKSSHNSWCCGERTACPYDKEVPCKCVCPNCPCCGFSLCNCIPFEFNPTCCPKIAEQPPESRQLIMSATEPRVGDEYLCCAWGPTMCTLHMPETYHDGLGADCHAIQCCCIRRTWRGNMVPVDPTDDHMLLESEFQDQCIIPPFLANFGACHKSVCRIGMCIYKDAFPCDAEVPCAFAFGPCFCCQFGGNQDPVFCKCFERDDNTKQIIRLAKLRKKTPGAPAHKASVAVAPAVQTPQLQMNVIAPPQPQPQQLINVAAPPQPQMKVAGPPIAGFGFCVECGTALEKDQVFCTSCGTKQR